MTYDYVYNPINCDFCLKYLTKEQVNIVKIKKREINLIKDLNNSEYLLCFECYQNFNRKEK